jgi:PD-(D/E)XK nuclease superfamily protein
MDNMLTTDQKGAIAELAITRAALSLGADVYRPYAAGGRYDLIFGVGPELLRVQCKWACLQEGVVSIRCYSSRRTAEGHCRRSYTSDQVDLLAAYCPELERCFLIPIDRVDGRPTVRLRVARAKNNQSHGINWADDFDFAATLSRLQGP